MSSAWNMGGLLVSPTKPPDAPPPLFQIESLSVSAATQTSKSQGCGVDNREQLSIGKYWVFQRSRGSCGLSSHTPTICSRTQISLKSDFIPQNYSFVVFSSCFLFWRIYRSSFPDTHLFKKGNIHCWVFCLPGFISERHYQACLSICFSFSGHFWAVSRRAGPDWRPQTGQKG